MHKHFVPNHPSISIPPVTEDLVAWNLDGLAQQIVDPSDPMNTEQTQFPWMKPFLCADNCNAFYVTIAYRYFDPGAPPYGIAAAQPSFAAQTLPLVTRPATSDETIGVASLEPLAQLLATNPFISRALPSAASVRFGDVDIGPSGSVDSAKT